MWEEGRWSGTRVTRFSLFACVLLLTLDLVITGSLGALFDTGFVLLCIGIALAVRPADFFAVGVLPPMLLLGLFTVLGIVHRSAISTKDDPLLQSIISGLAHHSGALLVGYAFVLAVLAVRSRVLRRSAEDEVSYSNRVVSPAPYRVISGAPEVKSTTVVGNDPHSPESMTASRT
ncbi:MAG: hypothetical protein JWQ74_3146 [Marmoricola sp.]|nr:hypothetical protein [Marmoricola sp.]